MLAALLILLGCGALAGWLIARDTTLTAVGAVLLTSVAAGMAFVLLDSSTTAGGERIRLPWPWALGLVLLGGAALVTRHFAGAGHGSGRASSEPYPDLAGVMGSEPLTTEEIALLYKLRWHMQRDGVAAAEATKFFEDVIQPLVRLQGPSEDRSLAFRRLAMDMGVESPPTQLEPLQKELPLVPKPKEEPSAPPAKVPEKDGVTPPSGAAPPEVPRKDEKAGDKESVEPAKDK